MTAPASGFPVAFDPSIKELALDELNNRIQAGTKMMVAIEEVADLLAPHGPAKGTIYGWYHATKKAAIKTAANKPRLKVVPPQEPPKVDLTAFGESVARPLRKEITTLEQEVSALKDQIAARDARIKDLESGPKSSRTMTVSQADLERLATLEAENAALKTKLSHMEPLLTAYMK